MTWYYFAATVLFGRPEKEAWKMTPGQIWALYSEYMNHEAAMAQLRSGYGVLQQMKIPKSNEF